MNFFAMAEDKSRIVITPMIWIYFALTIALTALTFLYYYFLLRRDNKLFQRFVPKKSFRTLVRRTTRTESGFDAPGFRLHDV